MSIAIANNSAEKQKALAMADLPEEPAWTTVVRRRASKLRLPAPLSPRNRTRKRSSLPSIPPQTTDSDPDPSRILQKIQRSMARVQESEFFRRFLDQLRSPQVLDNLRRAATSLSHAESFAQTCTTAVRAVCAQECRRRCDQGGLSEMEHRILVVEGLHKNGEMFCKLRGASKEPDRNSEDIAAAGVEIEERPPNDPLLVGHKDSHIRLDSNEQWDLQIVVYGLGKIAESEVSRCQFSLVLLLKQHFPWISSIEVYDPVLSQSECKVIQGLGCSPIAVNEEGRRTIDRPTVFYMPHCEDWLYDNLLQANWTPQKLSRLVILGNSFSSYQERWSSLLGVRSKPPPTYVLQLQQSADEIPLVATSSLELPVFNNMSWHFFPELCDRWSSSDMVEALA